MLDDNCNQKHPLQSANEMVKKDYKNSEEAIACLLNARRILKATAPRRDSIDAKDVIISHSNCMVITFKQRKHSAMKCNALFFHAQ